MLSAQSRIAIAQPSDPGAARRLAVDIATEAKINQTAIGKAALVATELATNVLKHAGQGELLLRRVSEAPGAEIEILAMDRGPGMDNIDRCMRDGYSTAGSAGTGLGAARRNSSSFDIYSTRQHGTVVLARIADGKKVAIAGAGRAGVVCLPIKGEEQCGDAWSLFRRDGRMAMLVVDGLGHGAPAAAASALALEVFARSPFDAPADVLEAIHQKLIGSRGGAVAVLQADSGGGILEYAAVGNIAGHLLGDGESRGLFTHNGIVGVGRPRIKQMQYAVKPGALLALHSDGLKARWQLAGHSGLLQCHPAVVAAALYREYGRGTDDVTVLVTELKP